MVFNRLFEQRAVSYQSLFASGDDISLGTLSGVTLNNETVFQVNAVFAAVSLISDTISTLPIDAYYREGETRTAFRPKPTWVEKPDIDSTREAFYSGVITSMLLDGNAFIRVFSNGRGEIVNLVVLNPQTVKITRNGLGRVQFNVEGEDKVLSSDEMVHIPDVVRPGDVRGVSRVKALKENFGLALALEKFAARFSGRVLTWAGLLSSLGTLPLSRPQILQPDLITGIRVGVGVTRRGCFPVALLSNLHRLTHSSRRRSKHVIWRLRILRGRSMFHPTCLALPGTNSYASVEQTNLAWVTHGLRPIIQKIEGAISPLLSRLP
jgi:hypothetical protein